MTEEEELQKAEEEKKHAYWKGRMQDQLHSIDISVTRHGHEIVGMSNHIGFDGKEIVAALSEIRKGMLNLAGAIEKAKKLETELTKEEIKAFVGPEKTEEKKQHADTTSK